MKAKELIEALQKLNPELDITVQGCNEIDSIRIENWEHWRDGEKIKAMYGVIYYDDGTEDDD